MTRQEFLYHFFNETLYPEVKANIDIISSYYRKLEPKNRLAYNIIKFIKDNDYIQVTPTRIEYLLGDSDFLPTESAIIFDSIRKAIKLDDKEILKKLSQDLEDLCYIQAIDDAKKVSKDNPQKFVEILQSFDYVRVLKNDIRITKIGDLDVSILNEKYNIAIGKSCVNIRNEAYEPLGGILTAQQTMVCGQPGAGKSMFMMQESLGLALQGKRIFYLALGDLAEIKFIIRMGAMLGKLDLSEAARRSDYCSKLLKEHVGDYIGLSCVPANRITSKRYLKKALGVIDEYDAFVVDYDANFRQGEGGMYLESGEIYADLTELTLTHGKSLMIGSQIKQSFWGKSRVPLEGAAESSKKQQFVDEMITIGHRGESSLPVGYLSIVKCRNGQELAQGVPYLRTSDGNLHEIDEVAYKFFKDLRKRKITNEEFEQYCKSTDKFELSEQTYFE